MRTSFVVLALLVGCRGGTASSPSSGSAANDLDLGTQHAAIEPPKPVAPPPAPADAAAPAPEPAKPAPPVAGKDFIDDAKLLFRVAACGKPDQPVPEVLGAGDPKATETIAKSVERHCKVITTQLDKFRAQYFEKNRPWFDENVPKDLPKTVVYPFGGGDLLSALVAFPDATEITTISLEQAGDPRRLRTLKPNAIEGSLGALRVDIGGLISVGSNTSENLSNQQRNELPGQVSSFLLGLVAGGYEPVAMRYFTIEDTGALHYLEQADIDEIESRKKTSKKLKGDWQSPNFSEAFANVEIQYQRAGETAVRTHRHIGWNLGNPYLKQNPQLLRHLEQKGKVTMLVKGASYLLWRGDFSTIRTYILDHLAWMLSDSTGVSPLYASKAGMVQIPFGGYTGAFLEGAQGNPSDAAFIELWQRSPRKKLGFRFGYVDKGAQAHLVITRPK
jgi:hypothetical protein